MESFFELREVKRAQRKFLSVGLDPQPEYQPKGVTTIQYLYRVVEATIGIAGCFKPNLAFFEGMGWQQGGWILESLIAHIKHLDPQMPVIADGKRGDIGYTNRFYAEWIYNRLGADAMTVNPYPGLGKAADVFLSYRGKMTIALCRTTNEGAREFQDRLVNVSDDPVGGRDTVPLYQLVARDVSRDWSQKGSVGLVAAATYPDDIAGIRSIARATFLLIPGVGKQKGDMEKSMGFALGPSGECDFVSNVSTNVLYAYQTELFETDPVKFDQAAAAAAEFYDHQIREVLEGR